MKLIDNFLNRITMYRLTLYYLIGLVLVAVVLSILGPLSYKPLDIIYSTATILIVAMISNYLFAKLFKATTNIESVFISALILVLLIPAIFPYYFWFFVLASVIAMGSKYLLTIEKRHLFNPAAVAVVATALLNPTYAAAWWIGTPIMLPFVLIGGLLLMRKTRRENLIISFILTTLALIGFASWLHSPNLTTVYKSIELSLTHTALFFFAFVMLTEPLTSPPTTILRQYYGIITAFFYTSLQTKALPILFTPEMALCAGNIFSYIFSPKYRLSLPLLEMKQLTRDTATFIFQGMTGLKFAPGQYMEWTLPHSHPDNRGNRRYFSLASSPTEKNPAILVKFYNPSSSFKVALFNLKRNQSIIAAGLAGDFTLPDNPKKPLVLIAGGVGIAPFRSMIKNIIDTKRKSDIVLFFTNKTPEDIFYTDLLQEAQNYGVNTVYVVTDQKSVPQNWPGEVGYLSPQMISKYAADWQGRTFYISGPQPMVQSYEDLLHQMGVKRSRVITDYFPGYQE